MINTNSLSLLHPQQSGNKRKSDNLDSPLPEKRYQRMTPNFPKYDRIMQIASQYRSYISSKFLTLDEKQELAALVFRQGDLTCEESPHLYNNFLFLPRFTDRTKTFCRTVLNIVENSPLYRDLNPSEQQSIDQRIGELCQKVERGRDQGRELHAQAVSATAAARSKSIRIPSRVLEPEAAILEDQEPTPENPEWRGGFQTANIRLNDVAGKLREFRLAVQEYRKASAAFDQQREQLTFAYSVQFEKMTDPTWTWSSNDTRDLNYTQDLLTEYAKVMNSLTEEQSVHFSEGPGLLQALNEYHKASELYDPVKKDFDQRVCESEESTDLAALKDLKLQLIRVTALLRSANPRCFGR